MKDNDLFYRLIWPHAPMLLRSAQLLCRSTADAEDLVQETLLKAFSHLDQFVEGTNVKGWLMTILRNTRIDRIRSESRSKGTRSLDNLAAEPQAPDTSAVADSGSWSDPHALLESLSDQQLISHLLELPEEIRWTLLLVDVEGLEMKLAADVMGIPAGTVKSRLHRGRAMLRQALESAVCNDNQRLLRGVS